MRVADARAVQSRRYNGHGVRTNAEADGELLDRVATPDEPGRKLLADAAAAMRLSARGFHRVLRVARIFREWIANVGRRDARTRIAHVLCEFALRLKLSGLGEQTGYQLPMTQEQLGDVTGLTSVHVNRTLKSLEADGLIERISPRAITIGDWKKLADAGDFDSNYLHLREGEPALA